MINFLSQIFSGFLSVAAALGLAIGLFSGGVIFSQGEVGEALAVWGGTILAVALIFGAAAVLVAIEQHARKMSEALDEIRRLLADRPLG
ncbi:hypothetical protein [Thioalkalivibrio sp. XN279]|uniref:hypothetical protein n=1 Tax=Thioalkalivibrio sp. XN279 TaxID=2714953 RepID=UPI00140BE264|nr:hypothetical protein [Thioalkalivibrio sp. XN279]NHA14159.1 hypothetical protein [Thioalkalivibrio sp. XN279]